MKKSYSILVLLLGLSFSPKILMAQAIEITANYLYVGGQYLAPAGKPHMFHTGGGFIGLETQFFNNEYISLLNEFQMSHVGRYSTLGDNNEYVKTSLLAYNYSVGMRLNLGAKYLYVDILLGMNFYQKLNGNISFNDTKSKTAFAFNTIVSGGIALPINRKADLLINLSMKFPATFTVDDTMALGIKFGLKFLL